MLDFFACSNNRQKVNVKLVVMIALIKGMCLVGEELITKKEIDFSGDDDSPI